MYSIKNDIQSFIEIINNFKFKHNVKEKLELIYHHYLLKIRDF